MTLVEAAGATAIYHSSFFIVNRGASYQYLDKTFTGKVYRDSPQPSSAAMLTPLP